MLTLVDRDFLSRVLRVREDSVLEGIPVIDDEDALILYTVVYLYALAKRRGIVVVDAGAGLGYSTLWLAKALSDACSGECRLVAVEKRSDRATRLRENLARAGLGVEVEVVQGDAAEYLRRVADSSLDIVFVDVEKSLYPSMLRLLEAKLVDKGIALFHNAFYPPPPAEFYREAERGPWRATVLPTSQGLMVAVKTVDQEG